MGRCGKEKGKGAEKKLDRKEQYQDIGVKKLNTLIFNTLIHFRHLAYGMCILLLII